jgi:hypothetical protein
MAHAGHMADAGWERLLDHLTTWGSAREVPGGIQVTFQQPSGEPRTVEIVASPAEWGEYAGSIWGVDDPAATDIGRRVSELPPDQPFLVYDGGDWLPSTTRDLPDPDDDVEPEPGGEWVVLDTEGNVVSRYADWIESGD